MFYQIPPGSLYYEIEKNLLEKIDIWNLYKKLNEKQRKIFKLLFQEYSNKEITKITGYSRTSVYYIKKEIREIIRPYLY